jgi:hypothetical protein
VVSLLSTAPVGAALPHTLHGHCGPAVVKLHVNGLLIGTPEAFCAPDTVAVYVVLAASALVGVNVATVFPPLRTADPATLCPLESTTVNDTVPGVTAWENVAAGATDTATPVAPAAGVTLLTVGGTLGVTEFDCDDAGPAPTAFVAETVKV